MYRVTLVVVDLNWVEFDIGHYTVCLFLLVPMRIWQNQLGSSASWWNSGIKVNSTQVSHHQGHPVVFLKSVI